MKDYEVSFYITYTTTVSADTPQEAEQIAYDEIAGGEWDNIESSVTEL